MTSSGQRLNQIEAMDSVFGNPLLLDKIVGNSIETSDRNGINVNDVYSIRLINKNCLQSASRFLKSAVVAMKKLSSDTDTSFHGMDYLNTKVINNFVSVFSKDTRLEFSILPLRLQFKQHHFVKENFKAFKKLFENCGDLVCILDVTFPLNGGSMPLEFGQVDFPNLKKISFTLDGEIDKPNIQTNARIFGSNENGLAFLQQILQQCKQLKSFFLKIEQYVDQKHASYISSLKLPTSITEVELRSRPTCMELKLLSVNKLPNLETLGLNLPHAVENEQMLFETLNNLKTQLKILYLTISFVLDSQFYLKLPVLEKLTALFLNNENVELLAHLKSNWPLCVPNLKHLSLLNFTESLIAKWFQGLVLANVKELTFFLSKIKNKVHSPNERILSQLQTAFPNLQNLTLYFDFNELTGLKYLFQNICNLKELTLYFYGQSDASTGYDLASTLLGISQEEAEAISNSVEHNVQVATDNPQSIMNLKELQCLTLQTPDIPDCQNYVDFYEMESCKKFGFQKMPELSKVCLLGGFKYGVQ